MVRGASWRYTNDGLRLLLCLALLLVPWPTEAWDTAPHQRITKAALDTLPPRHRDRLGAEIPSLIEIYCMYPDRYLEMERYGFVRKSAGPRTASEIRVYCTRPDGVLVHGAAGELAEDRASLVHLFERIVTSLMENRAAEAARYAGVLSHFIADSLSPPHALDPEELNDLAPRPDARINIHSAIERSVPEFSLRDRAPRPVEAHLMTAAEVILQECYADTERNRQDLPAMVKAVYAHDELALDVHRLRAGTRAAEILADALNVLFRIAESRR